LFSMAAVGGALTFVAACDSPRPSSAAPPPQSRLPSTLDAPPIDKIDLLLDIDNSRSMTDKQQYLAAAIPELLDRLAFPKCLDAKGVATGQKSDGSGNCPSGSTVEFRAIHDVHVGIVTSSLGSRGGDICSPTSSAHADDHGELRG
jgi:hypothetical protein